MHERRIRSGDRTETLLNLSDSEFDERQLIEAAQKDPLLFADLYELHMERVYLFVLKRVRHRQDAEDLTSEVFHKALENLPKYEYRGTPFAAWLFRIASNIMADKWKQAARQPGELTNDPATDDHSIEELERQALLFKLLADLPPDQKRVLVLRFTEQKSIREIAQDMGRSEGSIKQLQFRALQKLKNKRGDIDA